MGGHRQEGCGEHRHRQGDRYEPQVLPRQAHELTIGAARGARSLQEGGRDVRERPALQIDQRVET